MSRAALSALLSALLVFAAATVAGPASARGVLVANTLTVTNTNDSGAGSLRQAIADAVPGDTIDFNLPSGSTIVTSAGTMVVNKSLNISGPGAAALALSCQGQCRVLRVESGATVNITGLTIRDGFASPLTDPVQTGGAVVLNRGSLTLAGCVVTGGQIVSGDSPEPGVASGAGIDNFGTLTLTNSTVSGNVARGGLLAGENFSGDGNGGGINNRANATLILTNSTITSNVASGGNSDGRAGNASGGGIRNLGVLVMTNSTVSNNFANGQGTASNSGSGGSGSGGGVDNFGTMTADGCSFNNNSVQGGFAPTVPASAQGGGVNNRPSGTLTLSNSTLDGNVVFAGGRNTTSLSAAGSGGGLNNLSTARVSNCTFSNNVVRGGGSGANSDGIGGPGNGGGVANGGSLTLTNSTISGNEAQGGASSFGRPGGKASGGGVYTEGALTLTNSTVTLNTSVGGKGQTGSAEAGGIFVNGSPSVKPLNTIVAGNTVRSPDAGAVPTTLVAPDVSGTFDSQGHNLVGRNDGAATSFPAGTPNAFGDLVGTSAAPVDAKLGPLTNNGGPTRTHRPWLGSPAIEGGDNAVLSAPHNLSTDQRGPGFPRLFNSKVDIGADEAHDSAITLDLHVFGGVVEVVDSFEVSVSRTGDLSAGDVAVDIAVTAGTASARSDFKESYGTLRFAPGEDTKLFTIFITNDSIAEPNETVSVSISNPTGGATLGVSAATFIINDNEVTNQPSNPIDNTSFFVRQHYVDFLNRNPDSAGLNFWVNEIESCGANAQCRETKRINVSAAFFLSIEFKETSFYALRVRRVAFGNRSAEAASRISLEDFLRDGWQLGEGVVVGATDWERRLQENKEVYLRRIVESPAFRARYPETMTGAEYVDALIASSGVNLGNTFRQSALNEYGTGDIPIGVALGGTRGRIAALRYLSELPLVASAETNPAFVLSEYFGYLRRSPTAPPDSNDAGYQFWLQKLNAFGGDFVAAEMVKAFISSNEYRQRFGLQ